MQLKLISCNVFQREACWCLAHTPHIVDPEFFELGLHVNPAKLRERIQARIDAIDAGPIKFDAILLLYGLCGNAGAGLRARGTKLVMPRAHDCATILLGSKKRYLEVFGDNPSRPFSSIGYLERATETYRTDSGWSTENNTYEDYVAKYGEDNAKYLWETFHPIRKDEPALFIDIPETSSESTIERARRRLDTDGRGFTIINGEISLVKHLIYGEWNAADFLEVPSGQTTRGVYDMEEILRAEPD